MRPAQPAHILMCFLPVCVLRCLCSSSLLVNLLPQKIQLQTNGLSPVCQRRCALRWDVLPYTFPQPSIWQMCCFFFVGSPLFLQRTLELGSASDFWIKKVKYILTSLSTFWVPMWNVGWWELGALILRLYFCMRKKKHYSVWSRKENSNWKVAHFKPWCRKVFNKLLNLVYKYVWC